MNIILLSLDHYKQQIYPAASIATRTG